MFKQCYYVISNIYLGHVDAVKCFFCNTVLQNWQEHHDPWVQHAKASSKCGFVLLNKGEEYVKRVLQNKDNKKKHVSVDGLINYIYVKSMNLLGIN